MSLQLSFDKCKHHTYGLQLANNIKLALALQLAPKSLKLGTNDDISEPLLTNNAGFNLFDPNAILRYVLDDFKGLNSEESSFSQRSLEVLLHEKSVQPEHTSLIENSIDAYLGSFETPDLATRLITFVNTYALNSDLVSKKVSAIPEYLISALATAKAQTPRSTAAIKRTGVAKIVPGHAVRPSDKEILPKEGERNILITSALPYVNNVPHLGNIVGSVLSADIYSRYAKARNYNTLYICGTDEYGTATETKALEMGVSPRELCDKYHAIHRDVYEWFQIDFDYFGRTTTDAQTEIAQDIFTKLDKNGYLEEQTMMQLYCPEHKGYLADRYVEGECPKCHYEDARGDQCDKCGGLLDPFELIKPRCKLDNATPEPRTSQHVFLSLDKLEPKLVEWINKASEEGAWSKNTRTITGSWLREGLKPRCITRDLVWGTPVPLEKFKNKVMYVWFDAPIGYVSISANYTKGWEKWWKNPENVSLYQFMGKDNVPFHTVIFPSSQIGTGDNWTKLHHLNTTEYLQYEGGKFSKSRGVGVFGNDAKKTGVSSSVWRYYLAAVRPETSDSQFSWNDFVARNNSELLANLGNFVNRLIKFVNAKYNGVVPEYKVKNLANFDKLKGDLDNILNSYVNEMEQVHVKRGLELAMSLSTRGNQFLQENKLDNTLFSQYPDKSDAVVGVGLNIIYAVASIISPFMPETSTTIYKMLNAPPMAIKEEFNLVILGGHNINKAEYLFQRIDEAKIEEWRKEFNGNQSDA
ncbi:HCL301Wp [Eremothecium sinecaudum]|uniref:methionine--tRNA ligase n=1 Tax=Eremothecium sinecaudum TaxID=45286 RepID=A0A109UYH6_9SACH|nr:HCL301Wp [Eremothecium sinecaudum]AMD19850.1 HCL301Wp [Eremothecium sinecaudum]